ncbi:hypothetical protein G6O69_19515 [Pseudenhygromyxa sp. WMMC2535]|uniref:hypothetical protein n=1 Tax=Pseudenhygromyxa sp. WMMC2535 TaxID=2712867 RepID=UPI001551F97B|nr:hypothetical protein [Pseudenhygromyxa sp. WMMC2535]NVB40043.1 hypothetical protein [Pseudenhygromyxa sp. WMMC2535]
MDALFVIVAELLAVPLLLWALIALDLTLGVAMSVVAVLLGRRTVTGALQHRWRSVRKRLLWSLIFLSTALLLADLVFFETLVSLSLARVDERDDLEVYYTKVEGSFILGRIEFEDLVLAGRRGQADAPSDRFELEIGEFVIDMDTARLLRLDFAVEELSLEGARGSWDHLAAAEAGARAQPPPARDFELERMHVGELALSLRDHTHPVIAQDGAATPRALQIELLELDLGPLRSETAVFDLLTHSRGRGSVAGLPFELTSAELEGRAQTTLEIRELPLDALARPLEARAGIRASGQADLRMTNRLHPAATPDQPAEVELDLALELRSLELSGGEDMSVRSKLMLQAAETTLERLGGDFPLAFTLRVNEDELRGMRSLADSDLVERVASASAEALRARLGERATNSKAGRKRLLQRGE